MKEKRWEQRFENFEKAFHLLEEAHQRASQARDDNLLQEGLIQRFEYNFELGWKTIRDYLEYNKVQLDEITPRFVIKEAFKAKILENGNVWMEMLDDRNLMSHTYDIKSFNAAIEKIYSDYYAAIKEIYLFFKNKVKE